MSAKAAPNITPVILVAEDDPNDVLLLKRAFEKAGLGASVLYVSNGLEVIRYLRGEPPFDNRATHPLPDLLLLDLKMPGAGGLDVLAWLSVRKELAGIRVVIFSSCVAPEDSQRAVSLGACSCLTKPLNPLDLLPVLKGARGFELAE